MFVSRNVCKHVKTYYIIIRYMNHVHTGHIYIYITVYIHVLDIKFSIQIFKYMHKLADSS